MSKRFSVCKKMMTPTYAVPANVQQLIEIKRIAQDGIFEIRDKKLYDKCYRYEDTNYSIKDEAAQEDYFFRYCRFLNSMNVDFKIVIINHNQSEKTYRENILYTGTDDGLNAFRDAINQEIEENLRKGRAGIVQGRYLVVSVERKSYAEARSYFTSIENTLRTNFTELESRITALTAESRLKLLHDIYCLGKETDWQFSWEEAVRLKRDWKSDICPTAIVPSGDYLQIDDKFVRTLFIKEFPVSLVDDLLRDIMDLPAHLITAVDVVPIPRKVVQAELTAIAMNINDSIARQQRTQNKAELYSSEISYDKQMEKEEIQQLQKENRNSDNSMFFAGVTICIQANSKEELERITATVRDIATGKSVVVDTHRFQQLEAFNTSLPIAGRYVQTARALDTKSLAALMPFSVLEMQEDSGFYYGLNQLNHSLIRASRKALPSGHGWYFGRTGSGKSFDAKTEMIQVIISTEDNVLVIDPKGEYGEFIRAVGGTYINMSAMSDHYINPFDVPAKVENVGTFIAEKSEFILACCSQALRKPLDLGYQSIIDRCVKLMYMDWFSVGSDQPPIWSDFAKYLREQNTPEAEELLRALEIFVTGSLNVFNHLTNVDMDNRIVAFGLRDLGETLWPLAILIITEYIKKQCYSNFAKDIWTWIYTDEAHVVTRQETTAAFFEQQWKVLRSFGGICTGITQNVTDQLLNKTTEAMISNSEFICVLSQSPNDAERISRVFEISESCMKYVSNSAPGTGLYKFGGKIVPFDNTYRKDNPIYQLFNTNPNETMNQ